MKLHTGQIGQPYQSRFFRGQYIVYILATKSLRFDPGRRPFRFVLLKETLSRDSIRVANKRKCTALDMAKQSRGNLQVVLNELGLQDSFFLEQDLLQVGELQRALTDLDVLGSPCHSNADPTI